MTTEAASRRRRVAERSSSPSALLTKSENERQKSAVGKQGRRWVCQSGLAGMSGGRRGRWVGRSVRSVGR